MQNGCPILPLMTHCLDGKTRMDESIGTLRLKIREISRNRALYPLSFISFLIGNGRGYDKIIEENLSLELLISYPIGSTSK